MPIVCVLKTFAKKNGIIADCEKRKTKDGTKNICILEGRGSSKRQVVVAIFYLRRSDERSRNYQSCCCDIFLTPSLLSVTEFVAYPSRVILCRDFGP